MLLWPHLLLDALLLLHLLLQMLQQLPPEELLQLLLGHRRIHHISLNCERLEGNRGRLGCAEIQVLGDV